MIRKKDLVLHTDIVGLGKTLLMGQNGVDQIVTAYGNENASAENQRRDGKYRQKPSYTPDFPGNCGKPPAAFWSVPEIVCSFSGFPESESPDPGEAWPVPSWQQTRHFCVRQFRAFFTAR